MTIEPMTHCPYCNEPLVRWATPMESSWGGQIHLVCYNDDCRYFKDGWDHMWTNYEAKTSYRFKFDPFTGQKGPLPVWSAEAMRQWIVTGDEEEVQP